MRRLTLAVLSAAFAAALVVPVSHGIRAAVDRGDGLCDRMTPARMLENPALAEEWAQALRSSQPDEIARVRALLEDIRAAHGCAGELAGPEASGLPPGHPPIPEAVPGLPPGHPSVPSSPEMPSFAAPVVVTI
jgi:hypothetical protein